MARLKPLKLPLAIGSGRSFLADPSKLRLKFWEDRIAGCVVGKVWMGSDTIGPPGHVHGGVSCYVLDEAMGACALAFGEPAVAARITFEFLKMVPQSTELRIVSWLVSRKKSRTRVSVQAELQNSRGDVLVKAKGDFHRLTQARIIELIQQHGGNQREIEKYFANIKRRRFKASVERS